MTGVDTVLSEIDAWRNGKLWGVKAIADFAGRSDSTIVRWEKIPGCPITICGGQYFVLRVDLMLWMTSKQSTSCTDLADVR